MCACVSFSAHDCNFNLNAQRREGGTESGEGREREREREVNRDNSSLLLVARK